MERQRIANSTASQGYHAQLLHAIGRYLPRRGLPLQSSDQRVRWTDRLIVMTAVLMAWQPAGKLTDAFEAARDVVVSMYATRRRPGRHLRGFLEILGKSSTRLLAVVAPALRRATRSLAAAAWRQGPWVLMTVDGSRIDCPRTMANEQAFGCAGRKKTGPQQMLTMIFHLATGLIWDWRRGPGKASERAHLREMIPLLPHQTLLLADAGFTGYDLLRSLLMAGHHFIVRVGANVTLLKKLGYSLREHDGIVYLWPLAKRDQRPLILRRVEVAVKGKPMCLLTSVLEATALADRQILQLYRRRWSVEVSFRSLKQTMGHRKMLSQSPRNAEVELDWAVVGLGLLGLMTAGEIPVRARGRCSIATALRAVQRAMRRKATRPPRRGLRGQLRKAVVDRYRRRRPKAARAWPHKKNDRPPGPPRIRTAKKAEVAKAKQLPEAKL